MTRGPGRPPLAGFPSVGMARRPAVLFPARVPPVAYPCAMADTTPAAGTAPVRVDEIPYGGDGRT